MPLKLSIIITTYKRPQLLQRALRSVLTQDFDPATLEVIVSDDDPADSGRGAVVTLMTTEFPQREVRYLNRGSDRGGVAASRNRSMAAARGEWLFFLDDDDLLIPGALRALIESAEKEGADFCAGAYLRVTENLAGEPVNSERFNAIWVGHDQLLIGNLYPMGSFVIRRSIVTIPFNLNLRTHEDWLFLIDNLQTAKGCTVDQAVMEIRQASDTSRTHRNMDGGDKQKAADYLRIYALHPAPHLAELRRRMLDTMPPVTQDDLLGDSGPTTSPLVISTRNGRYLVLDQDDPEQSALMQGNIQPIWAVRLANALNQIRAGSLIDLGGGIGSFAIGTGLLLPAVNVFAINDNPVAGYHLGANLLLNKCANVHLIQLAPGGLSERSDLPSLPQLGNETSAFIRISGPADALVGLTWLEELVRRDGPFLYLGAASIPVDEGRRNALRALFAQWGYQSYQLEGDYIAYRATAYDQAALGSAFASLGLQLPTG